jgi:hypothetical protein
MVFAPARDQNRSQDGTERGRDGEIKVNWLTDQAIQVAGSVLILTAFVGTQLGRLDPKSRPYLLANALGSIALAIDAVYNAQWGFVLLEASWLVASLLGLMSAGRPARKAPDRPLGAAGGYPAPDGHGQLIDELVPVQYQVEADDRHAG